MAVATCRCPCSYHWSGACRATSSPSPMNAGHKQPPITRPDPSRPPPARSPEQDHCHGMSVAYHRMGPSAKDRARKFRAMAVCRGLRLGRARGRRGVRAPLAPPEADPRARRQSRDDRRDGCQTAVARALREREAKDMLVLMRVGNLNVLSLVGVTQASPVGDQANGWQG